MAKWETLWVNAQIATMEENGKAYGNIDRGAIAASDGIISWIGAQSGLNGDLHELAENVVDLEGCWVTPGLIDCHTHLVFGGNRADEFEQLLQGVSYEEIARAGGGIVSTVKATRQASDSDLMDAALPRIRNLIREGVTTIEIKSGYGLETSPELKQLRVARQLAAELPIDVNTTFLGAHALPPEFKDRSDEYIEYVTKDMLPEVVQNGLADAVDGFCETIGFSSEQIERVFQAAHSFNLPVKLHADQLSDLGGAKLAAKYNALSADHLEFLSEEGVEAMAASGTVAVLLPGAFYSLCETQLPPIELLRKHGVDTAIATDFNPGSSPIPSLLLMLNMACRLFKLVPEEVLAGVTRNAAKALGVDDDRGTLEVGKQADFAAWDIEHPAELAYWSGINLLKKRVYRGVETDILNSNLN